MKKYAENGDEELVIPAKNFTELDRLASVVHLIEEECQIVPVGAIKILPTHELIRNPGFRGLKIEEAAKLTSYLHYRKPKSEEKKLIIGKIRNNIRIRPSPPKNGLPRSHLLRPFQRLLVHPNRLVQNPSHSTQPTLARLRGLPPNKLLRLRRSIFRRGHQERGLTLHHLIKNINIQLTKKKNPPSCNPKKYSPSLYLSPNKSTSHSPSATPSNSVNRNSRSSKSKNQTSSH